jgi:prepilin-type N-terminal cleavage/methylation domain-containing protein
MSNRVDLCNLWYYNNIKPCSFMFVYFMYTKGMINFMNCSKQKAFTIVELVIVIAVIAILASILVPVFGNIITNAKKSSAMQSAKNALDECNTRHISETKGTPLPEGMVFESDGYWFTFIDGRLHEITTDEDVTLKNITASCWVSPSSASGETDIETACDSVIDSPPSVTIDGNDYNCTDVGYLKTDDSEYIFAFYTDTPFIGSAGGCDVYAGRIINAKSLVITSDNNSSLPSLYTVNIISSHCTANGESQCSPDADYILTVQAEENYTLTNAVTEVKINGIAYNSFVWNGSLLTIAKEAITGDVTISVSAAAESHVFSVAATGCTVNSTSGTAQYGSDLALTFTPNNGYTLDGSALTVTIGGESCTVGTQYSWDSGNGSLTIYGQYITGNINVSLTAVSTRVEFTWNLVDVQGIIQDANGNEMPSASYIDCKKDFVFRVVLNGCKVGTIDVTRQNGLWEKIPYGYNETSGCYFISGEYITGNIDVSVH